MFFEEKMATLPWGGAGQIPVGWLSAKPPGKRWYGGSAAILIDHQGERVSGDSHMGHVGKGFKKPFLQLVRGEKGKKAHLSFGSKRPIRARKARIMWDSAQCTVCGT